MILFCLFILLWPHIFRTLAGLRPNLLGEQIGAIILMLSMFSYA